MSATQPVLAAFVAGIAGGLLLARVFADKPRPTPSTLPTPTPDDDNDKDDHDDDDGASSSGSDSAVVPRGVDLKMVVCVRDDLGMSKGKIAAQVGHGVLGAYRLGMKRASTREWIKAWLWRGQAKITLKVESEEAMVAVAAAAKAAGLPVCVVTDAGHTEVAPGTRTVCGIGPAPRAMMDEITGPKGKFPLRLLA